MRATNEGVIDLKQLQEVLSSLEAILRKDGKVETRFAFKLSVMNHNDLIRTDEQKKKKMTLLEAMRRVLLAGPQEGMHSVGIAKEIIAQELCFEKDGSFVDEKQVRSCASNNKDIFVCLPGNMLKPKVKNKTIYLQVKESDFRKYL